MRTRLLSALVGAPLMLGAILWPGGDTPFPGWPLALLVLAMVVAGVHELCASAGGAGVPLRRTVGYAVAGYGWLQSLPLDGLQSPLIAHFGWTLLLVASLAWEALRRDRAPLRSLAPTWLGALWIGWLFPYLLRVRLASDTAVQHLGWFVPAPWMVTVGEGALLLLFAWMVTVAVDSGAYFVGKSIGRHKLAPVLSPGKTWEGSVGGFALGLVVGAALAAWLRLPLPFALAASAIIGVVSQLGDLSKSAIKRELGVKDFGALIPGHGGVLDRFDSLMFAAPAVYWLMVFWVG